MMLVVIGDTNTEICDVMGVLSVVISRRYRSDWGRLRLPIYLREMAKFGQCVNTVYQTF